MSELNWEKLCSLEPRLLDLEAEIKADERIKKLADPDDAYYGICGWPTNEGYKEKVSSLVGWHRTADSGNSDIEFVLYGTEAFDVAVDRITSAIYEVFDSANPKQPLLPRTQRTEATIKIPGDLPDFVANMELGDQQLGLIYDLDDAASKMAAAITAAVSEFEGQRAKTLDSIKSMQPPDVADIYWALTYSGILSAKSIREASPLDHNQFNESIANVKFYIRCWQCKTEHGFGFRSITSLKEYKAGSNSDRFLCQQCADLRKRTDVASRANYKQQVEARDAEIQRLKAMPYPEYLQTEHWKEFARLARRKARFHCQLCNSDKQPLHVHHRTYQRRGCEELGDVIVLCEVCHDTFHDRRSLSK